jgi:hypothetical protein
MWEEMAFWKTLAIASAIFDHSIVMCKISTSMSWSVTPIHNMVCQRATPLASVALISSGPDVWFGNFERRALPSQHVNHHPIKEVGPRIALGAARPVWNRATFLNACGYTPSQPGGTGSGEHSTRYQLYHLVSVFSSLLLICSWWKLCK